MRDYIHRCFKKSDKIRGFLMNFIKSSIKIVQIFVVNLNLSQKNNVIVTIMDLS